MNLDHIERADDASDPACPVNTLCEQLWGAYSSEFDRAESANNEFAVRLLLLTGASWEKGPRTRGQLPKFRKVKMSDPQEGAGNMASPHLLLLQACLRSLRQLSWRFGRDTTGITGNGDCRTWNTQRRLLRRLKEAHLIPFSVQQILAHDQQHLTELTLNAINVELKLAAIRKWREAMKLATTSMAIGKVVYQYLKKKGRVTPPNLVEDDAGNIVFDPQSAMNITVDKWDAVFAANAGHEHEMQNLKQVWPYIHDKGKPVILPPITQTQLWEQAQRRRPDAAAGLDGWLTREVQALPPAAFRPVAALLNAIEAGEDEFPTILTQVRMIILNKDGNDAPLSKRLISLQSIFTLLYTGLRFMQLQQWQQEIMPPQVKGGVKGRQMSEVHMTIQLEIDHAHSFHGHFAALKLDKSKCFEGSIGRCPNFVRHLWLPWDSHVALFVVFWRIIHG